MAHEIEVLGACCHLAEFKSGVVSTKHQPSDQLGTQVFAELPGKCTRASGSVVLAKCQFSFAYDVKAAFFRGQLSILTDLFG